MDGSSSSEDKSPPSLPFEPGAAFMMDVDLTYFKTTITSPPSQDVNSCGLLSNASQCGLPSQPSFRLTSSPRSVQDIFSSQSVCDAVEQDINLTYFDHTVTASTSQNNHLPLTAPDLSQGGFPSQDCFISSDLNTSKDSLSLSDISSIHSQSFNELPFPPEFQHAAVKETSPVNALESVLLTSLDPIGTSQTAEIILANQSLKQKIQELIIKETKAELKLSLKHSS